MFCTKNVALEVCYFIESCDTLQYRSKMHCLPCKKRNNFLWIVWCFKKYFAGNYWPKIKRLLSLVREWILTFLIQLFKKILVVKTSCVSPIWLHNFSSNTSTEIRNTTFWNYAWSSIFKMFRAFLWLCLCNSSPSKNLVNQTF